MAIPKWYPMKVYRFKCRQCGKHSKINLPDCPEYRPTTIKIVDRTCFKCAMKDIKKWLKEYK